MKRILLPILIIGVLLLGACGAPSTPSDEAPTQPQFTHYVNKEFGFSVNYPKDWILEELNPNEIGIKPEDSEYNQVQIGAYIGEPIIASMPESWVAASTEAGLQQFFDMLGGTNLNIFVNEPASGKWDWVVAFTVIYEDTSLQGGQFIKETESISYTLFFIHCMDWPEGQEVINSFRLIE
jgi:hypothetical protein